MAEFTVKQLRDFFHQKSRGDITRVMHRFAIRKAARLERFGKQNASSRLNVRSGRLRGSISGSAMKGTRGNVVLQLQAGGRDKDVSYARIHEEGGTIRPVNAKFLTIPISDKLFTGAGVQRYKSVRDVPDPLTFGQSRKGQPLLLHEVTGEVCYILKKQVKIPRRPYLKPAVDRVSREIGRELPPIIGAEVRIG